MYLSKKCLKGAPQSRSAPSHILHDILSKVIDQIIAPTHSLSVTSANSVSLSPCSALEGEIGGHKL